MSSFVVFALNIQAMDQQPRMNSKLKEQYILQLNLLSEGLVTDRSQANLIYTIDEAHKIAKEARHFELTLKKRADIIANKAETILKRQNGLDLDIDLSKMDISQ